jgi:hypothetical protein
MPMLTCGRPLSRAHQWLTGAMADVGHWKPLALRLALAGLFAMLATLAASPVSAQTPPPANDRPADAQAVGAPSLVIVDTSAATVDRDEPVPSCAPPGTAPIRRTVWYRVVTAETTLPMAAVVRGTSFRPILALYDRDAAGRLTQLACSTALSLRATVTPGQTYYLQVGGAGLTGHADGGKLDLILGPAAPRAGSSGPGSPDTTPPNTTASVAPAANADGWNNTNVTVSLSATDNPGGSGVQEINYRACLAGQNCTQAFTTVSGATATFTVSDEGETTVTFFAVDKAGNPEAQKTLPATIKIDKTKPVITGARSPQPNANGWNNADVVVTFTCAEVGNVQSGLDANTVAGKTVSTEGANQSVTNTGTCTDRAGNVADPATVSGINIDKTPPTMACTVSPESIWPPNKRLETATATVTVSDVLSGQAGFVLTSATSDEPISGEPDIVGFDVGTADTTGQLRADRLGSGDGRVYSLAYRGSDRAGNSATCTVSVTVPHDRGR